MHQTKRILTIYILYIFVFTPFNIFAHTNPITTENLIVVKNNSVTFDVSVDDKDLEEFGILSEAEFGSLILHSDNTITYKPHQNICEEIDSFQYYFKHTGGVDTLTVNVEILCESITVISGFSPTGLEDPTSFTILGAENYPNNKLYVFNELGNQVFFKENYRNDWQGDNSGEPLPEDVTYYYVFDNGMGETLAGYVQVN